MKIVKSCSYGEKLKTLIQELQRDLTVRRCLAKITIVSELDVQIKSLQQSLDEHFKIPHCRNIPKYHTVGTKQATWVDGRLDCGSSWARASVRSDQRIIKLDFPAFSLRTHH
jgi:predicted 2-oxoglutarate/Fe(II)-dependent dioxygenase YbiX